MNPDYVSLLKQGLPRILGADAEGEVRVNEHSGHSLFIGTPFVLQQRQCDKEHILCDAFYESCPGAHERLVQELEWSLAPLRADSKDKGHE